MADVHTGPETRPAAHASSIGDLLREVVGVVARRGRHELERAAREGRHGLDLRQLRRDREVMLGKLGREVIALVNGGEVDHPGLIRGVDRVRALDQRINGIDDGDQESHSDSG